MKLFKTLLITLFLISNIFTQDISGNFKLSGLSAVYYDFVRQESSVFITDNYGLGISAIGDTYSQGEAIRYDYQFPTPEAYLNSAGVQLYVNFYDDGSAAIAQGSTYPTSTTEDCISTLSTLPITGDQGYSSNLNSGAIIPLVDIVGLPSKSIYAGQNSGSCSITSSPVFDVFPQNPAELTIPFPINTISVSEELGELLPANTILPGQTAGYALFDNKLVSTIEQNVGNRPSLYLEWHAMDGPVNDSGLGDIIGEDEDGDGTDYDRIYGLETIRVTKIIAGPDCGAFDYPIAGRNISGLQSIKEQQCIDNNLDDDCTSYAENWINNCINDDYITASGNDVENLYAFDSNSISSLWGGIVTWNSVNNIGIDDSNIDFDESCMIDGDDSDCSGRLTFSYIPQCLPSFSIRHFMVELTELCEASEQDVCGVCGGDGPVTWYNDADRDGLGDPNNFKTNCLPGYCIQDESLSYTECNDANNSWDWLSMGICSDDSGTIYENLNPNMGDFEFCNYIMDNDVPGYENATWVWDRGFSTNNLDDDDTNVDCPEGLDADCLGFCGGDAVLDVCGNCGGDNSSCEDCAGTPNGDAVVDNCGVCASGDTGVDPCVQDCNLIWGGNSTEDLCGVCDDDASNDNEANTGTCDCNATPGGSAEVDNCGECAGGDTGIDSCIQDCDLIWGGDSTEDLCGFCDNDASNDNTPNTGTCDCNATPEGAAYVDGCNSCVAGNTGMEACPLDCADIGEGIASFDNCSNCICNGQDPLLGEGCSEIDPCVQDCDLIWGGDSTEDLCGFCDNDASNDNTANTGTCDCNATPEGTAEVDGCGDCAGGDTGLTPCEQDCAGFWGGPDNTPDTGDEATYDLCVSENAPNGICGGDNSSCADCAGVPNGHSNNGTCSGICLGIDETDTNGFTCSNCIDGGFGSDCLGECGGLSVVDECSFCNDPLCSDSGIQSPFTVDYNPCDEGFFPTNSLWNSSCADCLGTINGTAYENLLTEECETILSTNGTIPIQFAISKIYPNPFNPVVTIAYSTPTSQYIEGHIYNLSGARISTVVSQYHSAGNYFIKWNATGKPSGIYIFILKTESEVKSQKLLLLK